MDSRKKRPPEREHCGWIEGTAQEVLCLAFLLDIGDIREEVGSEYRRRLICSMYGQEQWGTDREMEAELMKLCDDYSTHMERLQAYLEEGNRSGCGTVMRRTQGADFTSCVPVCDDTRMRCGS